MAKGKLQCCGTSLFLKNSYGVGYTFTVTKEPSCDVSVLTKTIMSNFPTPVKHGDDEKLDDVASGTEVSFALPLNGAPQILRSAFTTNLNLLSTNFSITSGAEKLKSYIIVHQIGMTVTLNFYATCSSVIYK